jgi:hypothetical protein
MNHRMHLVIAAAGIFGLLSVSTAAAQNYRGTSGNVNGPTVSPYLNLLQNNNADITNYQSLVRPLINQNSALQRQGGAIQQLQQQQRGYGNVGSGGTGIHSYFMFYSHYYPSQR